MRVFFTNVEPEEEIYPPDILAEEEWYEDEDFFEPGVDCDLDGYSEHCLKCPYWGGDGICKLMLQMMEMQE